MAHVATQHGLEVWTIRSADGHSRATFVPELGGLGSSLVLPAPGGPRELLHQHPFFWERAETRTRGGLPFLFPICGRLERGGAAEAYLYDGRVYRLPLHGFALRLPWEVLPGDEPDTLALRLRDTAATRAAYPFAFEVRLTWRLRADGLAGELACANTGLNAMPYNAGFHPYFLTPDPAHDKAKASMDFKPARRWVYNEQLTDVVGEQDPPRPPLSVAAPAINEMLVRLGADKEARLAWPDGWTIHLAAEGVEDPELFPFLQFYTQADQPFFCAEPWMGFPNALNTVAGARWLAPGQAEHGCLRIWTTW